MDSLCNIYLPSLQCFDTILNGLQPLGGHMFWACLGVYVGYNSWMYILYIYIWQRVYRYIQRVFYDIWLRCACIILVDTFDTYQYIHTRAAEAKIFGFISSTLNFLWCPLAQHPLVRNYVSKLVLSVVVFIYTFFLFQIQSKVRAIEESDADSKKHSL